MQLSRLLFAQPPPVTVESADKLVERLDSFDAAERRSALEDLARREGAGVPPERRDEVNLHCHTSFSFNAYGYSPSRFAWEAHRYGLEVAGIVDFDVLDGMREFLEAGRLLSLKTVAGFETRVFVPEYSDKVTNSPHEPGVAYLITSGFTEPPQPGTPAARTLASMADCARRRNLKMMARVNEHLDPVTIDYERDVLPLTPAGNATERHMLVAYERTAREQFPDRAERARFWAEKLGEPEEAVGTIIDDAATLKDLIRARLMKYGGVGYAEPEEGSFPMMDEVVRMTLDCEALPSGGWLDGTNRGEADSEKLFRFWVGKGIPTVTIIPDRNWNLEAPLERAVKVRNFHEAVSAAVELDLPILVGTEMNKAGNKFVDTFAAPEVAPHREEFLDGAHFAWGHTLLRMTAGVGATSEWAGRIFGDDTLERNAFFRRIGEAPYPGAAAMRELTALGGDAEPDDVLRILGLRAGL